MREERAGATQPFAHAQGRRRPVMLREIHEAPERVESLIAREGEALCEALAPFRRQPPPLILVAGRGTSDHAAVYAQYVFEHYLGIPVMGAALSLFTLYPSRLRVKGALVVGLSQSGESPDVVKTVRVARKRGAFTLAITNTAKSSLSEVADYCLNLQAHREKAVAATKTYTAELVAALLICRALGGGVKQEEIEAMPGAIRVALGCEEQVAEVAPYYRYAPRCLCLARGFNYATAREIALKLMETCYLGATGMSGADFLHGPIAFVESATPVVLFAAKGPTYPFMVDLAKRLAAQEVDALGFTNQQPMLRHCALGVYCPVKLREALTPVPFATLGQLLACHLALMKGLNPDAPRRLKKVTRTW